MSALANRSAEAGAVGLVGAIGLAGLAVVWEGFWSGFLLSVLWGWFVSPLFGLPVLGIAQAYGLALVARALRASGKKSDEPLGDLLVRAVFLPPMLCGLFLLVGWVAKGLM